MTSDESRPGPDAIRLSDAERETAIAALGEHRQAGRLTGQEYEERWALVRAARVRGDLAPVFADLPGPLPADLPGPLPAVPAPVAAGGGPVDWGRLIAVVPFIALVLFFVTGDWLWFLLIPVSGIVLGAWRRGKF